MNEMIGTEARKQALKTLNQLTVSNILTKPEYDAKLEILDGNIGYLDLRSFQSAHVGGETAAAAMAFLSNADAVIIDLRRNGGGDPTMIQLLSSYFFA